MTASEQARADAMAHECVACEGHKTIEHAIDDERYEMVPCPVCGGAGLFFDRMPAADALADAETLNLYADQFGPWDAIGYGRFSAPNLENVGAVVARARAAFRAVPGLR